MKRMVEWKNIGDISLKLFAGGTPSTNHDEYYDGDIPWIRSGEIDFNVINKAERNITEVGYKNSSAKMIRKNSVVMAMTGATVAKSAIVAIDTSANQSVCAIETDEDIANFKFVYYCLANNYFKIKASAQGALTSLNLSMIKQIEIPIPSISEQNRIVGILDTFTASIDNLKEQIAQRRKQYEYYRDQLLDLEEKEGVEMKKLGEIVVFRNGKGHEKIIIPDGKYIVVNSKFISSDGSVKKYCNEQISPLYVDDILMVMSDVPNGKAIAKCYLVERNNLYTLNQRIGAFHVCDSNVITKYLFYVINRNEQLLQYDNKIDQTNLKKDDILNITIPLPPLQEQQRIVSILDTFEASIQNLEAQLSQREKQYEYYRNKLLTFE